MFQLKRTENKTRFLYQNLIIMLSNIKNQSRSKLRLKFHKSFHFQMKFHSKWIAICKKNNLIKNQKKELRSLRFHFLERMHIIV